MRTSIAGLWRDRAGKFAPLKAAGLLLALYPAAVLLLRALAGDLGSRPITEAIHSVGDWTVRFFLLSLAITPTRALLDMPRLIPLRRVWGVTTACYAGLHLLLYSADQGWNLPSIVSEIVLRFYLTIGFVALLALGALAITSTDAWQRRLRHRWKQLHRLVWPIGVLGLFHYFLQAKSNVAAAAFNTGLFYALVLWRLTPRRWQTKAVALLPITALAALATAGTEFAWYGLATKINPWRVLAANLDVFYSLRPAPQVMAWGFALCAAVGLRRWYRARRAGLAVARG